MIQRILFSLSFLLFLVVTGHAQRYCATAEYDSLLQHRHTDWFQSRAAFEKALQQKNRDLTIFRTEEETIYIPVVVHVVHKEQNSQPGTGGNISDAQIRSQIEVLNEDYRRKPNTKGFNENPVGADVNIEFYLATCDPAGEPTLGITRTYNSRAEFDVFSDDEYLKSLSYWPSDQYLNIWVTDVKSPYIGYTQFPDMSGLPGLGTTYGPATTDGVVIDYKVFGRQIGAVTSSLYGHGRTTTHEIGHWLGLKHTWGDTDCGEDYCNDTPPTRNANQSNDNDCTPVFSNCRGATTQNMIENYMDYSPDLCMNIFTQDQKARIWKALDTSPRRKALVANASRCEALLPSEQLEVEVYPNPVNISENGNFGENTLVKAMFKGTQDISLRVYDTVGRMVYSRDYEQIQSRLLTFPNGVLAKGMYFVTVTSAAGEKKAQRLVVIR